MEGEEGRIWKTQETHILKDGAVGLEGRLAAIPRNSIADMVKTQGWTTSTKEYEENKMMG